MASINGVDLGTFGIWTFDFESQPAALMRDSVRGLEELGWRALWIPELLGREAFSHAGYLLSCTERLAVINGIAQIWSRGAFWTHGASVLLADAYPGRHVLGLAGQAGQAGQGGGFRVRRQDHARSYRNIPNCRSDPVPSMHA